MEINKEKLEQLKEDHKHLLINNIPSEASRHFRGYWPEPIYVRYVDGKLVGWNPLREDRTAYDSLEDEILEYSIIDFSELLISNSDLFNIFKNTKRKFKKL